MTRGGAARRLALGAVLGASVLLDAWGLGWGLAGDYSWAPDELLPSAVRAGRPCSAGLRAVCSVVFLVMVIPPLGAQGPRTR